MQRILPVAVLILAAYSPAKPIKTVAAAVASRGCWGLAAKYAAIKQLDIQPVPVNFAHCRMTIFNDKTALCIGNNVDCTTHSNNSACLLAKGLNKPNGL